MRKLVILVLLILPAAILFFLALPDTVRQYPSGKFKAVIISDLHTSNDETKMSRLATLTDLINKDELPDVGLFFITGDVVSYVFGDYPDTTVNNRIEKTTQVLKTLKIPYYFILGNHDYKLGGHVDSDGSFSRGQILEMEGIWRRSTGTRPFYRVTYQGWKFICLNTMRGRYLDRNFDPAQIEWLRTELLENLPVIILMHHPLETDGIRIWCKPGDLITEEKEPVFFDLLRKNRSGIKGIFVGHGHMRVRDMLFSEIPVYETAGFGDSDELEYAVVGFNLPDSSIDVAMFSSDPDLHTPAVSVKTGI